MIEDYLAIERERLSDRLEIEVRASPEARTCLVPPLLLQPLVENAIRHGVSASSEAGRVSVSAKLVDGRLIVIVSDDGPGFGSRTPRPGSGTGLSNTRERLLHAYGAEQQMIIEDAPGARVRLELPATVDEDEIWETAPHG